MGNSPFFNFFTLLFFKEQKRHLGIVFLSVLIISLLSSVMFISDSLQYSLNNALDKEADFVVQRVKGGDITPLPVDWIDEISDLNGVSKVTPRVWGRYYVEPKGKSFLIVGVDFLDEEPSNALGKIIGSTNLRKFLSGKNMLIGAGVAKYLDNHFYKDSYRFLNPKGKFISVHRFKTLNSTGSLFDNDLIIVPIDLAREILGYNENYATDILFNVPNDDEWSNIESKVSSLHYDLRVVNKKENKEAYSKLFDYKGGFFLALFLVALLAFVLILYQRYTQVFSNEKRQIGIFRALGWSIKDILKLKIYETLSVVIISFVSAVSLSYIYVFILDAPLLKNIFLGGSNLDIDIKFIPVIDFSTLSAIFFLYAVPFLAVVLIPVWKISVSDPKEAML